ncbi:MAG: NYN domain-containing protein [Candidatus Pararuminococcus gallinarum]
MSNVTFLKKLFGSPDNSNPGKAPKSPPRPKAIAFVDYEHWYYSYQNLFGMRPDVESWRKELADEYEIEDIYVFGEFGHKGIHDELSKLRTITNTIIETQQPLGHHKKDMTDFIMLDYIYQHAALHPETDTYIIFTGDGHFLSVVRYLTQRANKHVIVYGVNGAFSSHLREVASESRELPDTDVSYRQYCEMIVENLVYVADHPTIISTFNGTVGAVARKHGAPEEMIRAALRRMLDEGLIVQKEQWVDFNRKVRVLRANWEALVAAGLWTYDE